MPGVVVTTATRGAQTAPTDTSGQAFFVGLSERGDTAAAILLRGMADVTRLLGNRPSFGNLYDQLKIFFDEGGEQAYVARVVGPAASKGTLTLSDRAGTPVNTLKVDAQSAGAWSSNLTVEVQDGSVTNTFRIIVRLSGDVVEDVTNIGSPAEAVAKFSKSPYVRLTNLGSASATPSNNPKVAAAVALSAGADDRASVTSTHYINALALFVPGLGDGAVAIPGQSGTTVWNGIIAHAEANNRLAILASTQSDTDANLKTSAAGLDSEFAGLFAPWIVVSDGGYGTRTVSPEGFVMACRARAHKEVGPWRSAAGKMGEAITVLDLDVDYNTTRGNDLSSGKVSVIREIAGKFRLYDWRSLSVDMDNYYYLSDRDLLNRLVVDAGIRLEDYVFEPIDGNGHLLANINAALVGMVDPIANAGGLYPLRDASGRLIDPGYKVETGSDINTPQSLSQNMVQARLLVRVSPTGGLISLTIVKVGVLAGL